MANTAVATPTRLESFLAEVLPPNKAADLYRSLPSHIKPQIYERNISIVLMENPELMQFPPALIYREVAKAASLGLYLDPALGEAYIVVAYNYKTQRKEPQLRIGYRGMIKLARQTGNVSTIACHEVCALDDVEVDLGCPKVFHHRPKLFTERGPVVGYVATIEFKDHAAFDLEPMSVRQCHAIRERSDAWKAFKENKIKSTPWSTDEIEMCKKTDLRRLLKRQEQSPEIVRAYQIEDEAEYGQAVVQGPQRYRIEARTPAPEGAMIEGPQDQAPKESKEAQEAQAETQASEGTPHVIAPHNRETGEVLTWQEWGSEMIAAVRTAKTEAKIDAWVEQNNAHMSDFKVQAANMYRLLENEIRKHREKVSDKGETKSATQGGEIDASKSGAGKT